MASLGYVIRAHYLDLAKEKATTEQLEALDGISERAREIDALERSFPDRLRAAREAAGIPTPELSRAARDWVAMSADADREVHRLLLRRCRRAGTAADVVRELLTAARDDLDASALDLSKEDEPVQRLSAELNGAKRAMVEELRAFVRG